MSHVYMDNVPHFQLDDSSCLFTWRDDVVSGKRTRVMVNVMRLRDGNAGPVNLAARVVLETCSGSGYHGLPLAILDCLVPLYPASSGGL